MEKIEYVICPQCNGKGYITITTRITCDEDITENYVCPKCNGHRVLKQTTIVKIEPISNEKIVAEENKKIKIS